MACLSISIVLMQLYSCYLTKKRRRRIRKLLILTFDESMLSLHYIQQFDICKKRTKKSNRMYISIIQNEEHFYQLEDHQDTNPKPSSFTQPITCITEGRFSSGGSPIEDDDLLRTANMHKKTKYDLRFRQKIGHNFIFVEQQLSPVDSASLLTSELLATPPL